MDGTKYNLPQKETTDMVWPSVKEGKMDANKKMINMQVQGKRRRGRPTKIRLDNVREDVI